MRSRIDRPLGRRCEISLAACPLLLDAIARPYRYRLACMLDASRERALEPAVRPALLQSRPIGLGFGRSGFGCGPGLDASTTSVLEALEGNRSALLWSLEPRCSFLSVNDSGRSGLT